MLVTVIQHGSFTAFRLPGLATDLALWTLVELFIWGAILWLSGKPDTRMGRAVGKWGRPRDWLVKHRGSCAMGIFLVVFIGRLSLLPFLPVPAPRIPDEFSQLLQADTFTHGRVTNPTHPMWFYFETPMENQKPTYDSMYPPGPGLFMAASQALTGQPWYGVLFSVAAAAAAVCWMLQGWMQPRWALWGSLMFLVLAVRNQATEGYFGEGVNALGAALLLGSLPRMVRKQSVAAAASLAIGISLLAVSRPYEGAFLVAALCIGGIWWARNAGLPSGTFLRKAAAPVAAILLPVFVWVGYLNWRATGSPLLPPYELNLIQQHITRPFMWQKPAVPPPTYDHTAMAAFYQEWELDWWRKTHSFPQGFLLFWAEKAHVLYVSLFWPFSVLVAIASYQLMKRDTRRFLALALGLFCLGLSLEGYQLLPRYLPAAWPLVILLAIYGLRYIRVWRRQTRWGLRISRVALVLIPAGAIVWSSALYGAAAHSNASRHSILWSVARQQILQGLESLPGKQLVIVRYSAKHFPVEEWVYNRADIDAAKVVWARDVPIRGNADLLRYFKDRTVWLLEPDGDYAKLAPYCSNATEPVVSQVGVFRVSWSTQPCEAAVEPPGIAH